MARHQQKSLETWLQDCAGYERGYNVQYSEHALPET